MGWTDACIDSAAEVRFYCTSEIISNTRLKTVAEEILSLIDKLDLFVEVANMRHFGRAAAALDMPPSTLSRRIAELEKELGTTLIRRSTRSFALTESGSACYDRAVKVLAGAAEIKEVIGRAASSGQIRIGAAHDLAETFLIPILAQFSRTNPAVSLELKTGQCHPNVLADGLDVAITVAYQRPIPDSTQRSRKLAAFARRLFASEHYIERNGAPSRPIDLRDHACLRFSRGGLQKAWELRRGRERSVVNVGGSCSASSVGF